MSEPLPIKGFHHLELVVGNALQAAYFYRKAFGFDQVAYLGPETGYHEKASYFMQQGEIRIVLTTPLTHNSTMNVFQTLHGDSVQDIAFEVDDVDAVYDEAVSRGARSAMEPASLDDKNGKVRKASVHTYGETIHSFISLKGYDGVFMPGFEPAERKGQGVGLTHVDHVVGNVEDRQMDRWGAFYERVFGFHQFVSYDDKDISTDYSALRSKVMASRDLSIKMPINEPAEAKRKSQIQEYIDYNFTAGVQHIAMYTDNIVDTVTRLRKKGVKFLGIPETYYETVWDRVGEIEENREDVRRLRILVDRDENGYLLQIFTKPVQDRPTLFMEIIQRMGCESFGKGNFKALFESIEIEQERRGHL